MEFFLLIWLHIVPAGQHIRFIVPAAEMNKARRTAGRGILSVNCMRPLFRMAVQVRDCR